MRRGCRKGLAAKSCSSWSQMWAFLLQVWVPTSQVCMSTSYVPLGFVLRMHWPSGLFLAFCSVQESVVQCIIVFSLCLRSSAATLLPFHVVFLKWQVSRRGLGVSSSPTKLKAMACEGTAMGHPSLATVSSSPTVMDFCV